MLQPNKKKLNPAQKTRAITSKTKSKAPVTYDVDWDTVRAVNDNVAVQAVKMFDPTGISSYPDVYYAAKDLSEGKGSVGNLVMNIVGALPMVGKAKAIFRLGKAANASKTVKNTVKVAKATEKLAAKANKATSLVPLATSANRAKKVVGKTAVQLEKVAKWMSKPITPKSVRTSSKVFGKTDAKNLAVDILDLANVSADAASVVKQVPGAAKQTVENTKKVVEVTKEGAKKATGVAKDLLKEADKSIQKTVDEKVREIYNNLNPIDKKKTIQYYNTDPNRGEVEKPGQLADVQYVPVSNSAQLKKWKEQKLAYGTNSQGIMKSKMNPRKKYANGSSAKGMNTNNYIISPAQALADYDIMMAKVEQKAMSNPWLPIVAAVGGAAQSFISSGAGGGAGGFLKGNAGKLLDKAIPKGMDIIASNSTGTAQAAMGMNDVQQDVEVEDGERYITPQGQTGEFEGATHEENGIPLQVTQDPNANPEQGQVPEGTQVFSDRLKVGDKTIAERQATRERQTAKLEKMASEPLVDKAIKNSLQRKMQAIEKEKMADLDFQEKVNNIQQMADTMVAAFGTGMAGLQDNPIGDSMRYGYGSGSKGVQKYYTGTPPTGIKYGKGYDESMFKDFFAKYNELNPGGVMDMNFIQGDLGMDPKTGGFGKVFGPGTYKASQDWLAANKDKKPDPYVLGDANEDGVQDSLGNNPNINLEALQNFKIGEGINDNASLSYGDPYAKDGVNFEMPTETIMTPVDAYSKGADANIETEVDKPGTAVGRLLGKAGEAVGKIGVPNVGDMTKLIGNYLGMTSCIKTANEQRATDIPFQNVFKNAGEEAQRMLDNAKQGIETGKAQAIVKANTNTRTGKKAGRNSARGVNQMRAMDWLYDTALNTSVSDIMARASEQMAQIDVQKSGVSMNADQLKGQGEWQRMVADAAAKDAYYTALALGRKDFATGLQQSGKDLNDMKTNKILEKLLSQSGEYAGMTAKGDFFGKPATASKTSKGTTKEEVKVQIDTQGNKFIMLDGKKITVTV